MENISLSNKLRDVSLAVHSGEIVGIGGLKGAGGESLLSLIMGDLRGWRGSITYRGKPLRVRQPAKLGQKASLTCPATAPPKG